MTFTRRCIIKYDFKTWFGFNMVNGDDDMANVLLKWNWIPIVVRSHLRRDLRLKWLIFVRIENPL